MRETATRQRRVAGVSQDSAEHDKASPVKSSTRWTGDADHPKDDYTSAARSFYETPSQTSIVVETVFRRKKAFANLHQFDGVPEIDTVPTAIGFHSMDSADEVEEAKSRATRYEEPEPVREEPAEEIAAPVEETTENEAKDDVVEMNVTDAPSTDPKQEDKDQKLAMLKELEEKKEMEDETIEDDDSRYHCRPEGPEMANGLYTVASGDSDTCPPVWKSASEEEVEDHGYNWMVEEAKRVNALNAVVVPQSMLKDFDKSRINGSDDDSLDAEEAKKGNARNSKKQSKSSKKASLWRRLIVGKAAAASVKAKKSQSTRANEASKSKPKPQQEKSKPVATEEPKPVENLVTELEEVSKASEKKPHKTQGSVRSDPVGSVAGAATAATEERSQARQIALRSVAEESDPRSRNYRVVPQVMSSATEKASQETFDNDESTKKTTENDFFSGWTDWIISGFDGLTNLGLEQSALAFLDWSGEGGNTQKKASDKENANEKDMNGERSRGRSDTNMGELPPGALEPKTMTLEADKGRATPDTTANREVMIDTIEIPTPDFDVKADERDETDEVSILGRTK